MKLGWKIALVVIFVIIGLILFLKSNTYKVMAETNKYHRAKRDAQTLNQKIIDGIRNNRGMASSSKPAFLNSKLDPWDNQYLYYCPGKMHSTGYDIVCLGADGAVGGKGLAKDIILGVDGTKPVKISKVISNICPNCKEKVSQGYAYETVSYHNAQERLLANGKYKPFTKSRQSQQFCDTCQAKEEAKTKMVMLLRKSMKKVTELLGAPSSNGVGFSFLMLGPEWNYDNWPSGGRAEVRFKGEGPAARSYYVSGACRDKRVIDIVPQKIYEREPDRINVIPFDNRLEVIWYLPRNLMYAILVYPPNHEKVYEQINKVDTNSGEVSHSYKLSNLSWKDYEVICMLQVDLSVEKVSYYRESPFAGTLERTYRVK